MPESEATIKVSADISELLRRVSPITERRAVKPANPAEYLDPETGMTMEIEEEMAEGRPVPVDTKYLRETYPEDEVIQTYADVIERNLALWEGIKRVMSSGQDLSGYQLRDWRVEYEHQPNGVLTATLTFGVLNMKEGVGGRRS